jgi:hypothetical protein
MVMQQEELEDLHQHLYKELLLLIVDMVHLALALTLVVLELYV